ncbi:hypothetical protein HHK36_014971 [Tetracentron sinense]|uniref:Gnk2-homologous domain-containing protein n=1 Tax=Tetracentron sinense TaxID=13715 RepID=A0A834Z490_TETSI|nr:hypothetical protein HHK36_014971 [Tetracentron sinense]
MFLSLFSFLFFLSGHLAVAYEESRWDECGDGTTYTPNSTFSANLGQALDNLRNNTALTGFNATTVTNGTDPVTALALCRATLTPLECKTCVEAAALGIRQRCPNQTVAAIWYSFCMLRYSTINFLNTPDTTIALALYDTRNVPQPDSYNRRAKVLMQNLSVTAGDSDKRYGLGRTRVSDTETIYSYVECTRDLRGQDCTRCLLLATNRVESCCPGKWAVWITTPSCGIQFNLDPTYNDLLTAPEIPTDPLPPPPLWTTDSGVPTNKIITNGGIGGKSVMIGVTAAAVGTVVLVVGCLLVVMKRRKREKMRRGGSRVVDEDVMTEMRVCVYYRACIHRRGYMAPEYAVRGLMSTKIDVYSFGVLMLEIVSGRKNYDLQLDEQRMELLNLAWRLEQHGRLMELVDVTIGSFPEDEVLKCIKTGLLCCQESIGDRPTMSSALMMLVDNSVTVPIPGRPGYQGSRGNSVETSPASGDASSNHNNEEVSNNTITTSLVCALIGFNTTTAETRTDPVTALALFRGDIAPLDCQSCIDAAVLRIRQLCPNQTVAAIWYSLCMLCYSITNFLTTPDNAISFTIYDQRKAPQQDVYNQRVKVLLQNLSFTAGKSEKRYALGWTKVANNQTLYGYVECTRDLNSENCTNCLLIATKAIDTCSLGQWAGCIGSPSCAIRFNMDGIYVDSIVAPEILTDPPVSPPPTTVSEIPTRTRITKGGIGGKRVVIGVTTAAVGTVILVVIGCLWVVVKRETVKKGGAWRLEQHGSLMELVDVAIGSFPQDEVLKCIRIGLLCCQESLQDRPTMSSAMLMLSNNAVTIPNPGRPGYQGSRDNTIQIPLRSGDASSNQENESASNNTISTSLAYSKLFSTTLAAVINSSDGDNTSNWDCSSLSLLTGDCFNIMDSFSWVLAGMGWTFFEKINKPSLIYGDSGYDDSNSVYLFMKVDSTFVYLFRKVDSNRV